MTTLHEIAKDARTAILESVEESAKRLLLTPGLGINIWRVVRALDDTLDNYEALVKAAHNSSTEQFALQDLRFEEKRSYENAQHLLKQLNNLYRPQEMVR